VFVTVSRTRLPSTTHRACEEPLRGTKAPPCHHPQSVETPPLTEKYSMAMWVSSLGSAAVPPAARTWPWIVFDAGAAAADLSFLLLEQAQILDGELPEDPAAFANRLNRLVMEGLTKA